MVRLETVEGRSLEVMKSEIVLEIMARRSSVGLWSRGMYGDDGELASDLSMAEVSPVCGPMDS